MKLGIMQPYFFPYIGYFQLIKSVDKFVLYDDVNYIKQGWINRNRLISNNAGSYFTLMLQGASSFRKINEIQTGENKGKLLKTISQVYSKAPFFSSVLPMIESVLVYPENNLSLYLENIIRNLCLFLRIPTELFVSSRINKDASLKGAEKVIAICKQFNAKEYINPIGGQSLYGKDAFAKNGLELKFIQSRGMEYKQFDGGFVPGLSIIDVMMFNSPEEIWEMLKQYELI